jgi:hypothetical protein
VNSPSTAPASASPAPVSSPEGTHPDPVATISMPSGNKLEFYDFGESVLVAETGEATSAPQLSKYSELIRANRMVELVEALRPDVPVPDEIYVLQAKHPVGAVRRTTEVARSPEVAHRDGSGGGKPRSGGIQPDNACSNNCCDPTWTHDTLCAVAFEGFANSWYLFDYGWSYADYYGQFWSGTACAGIGDSRYTVNCNGNGGTWTVTPGNYMGYGWFNYDTWCDGSVNTSTNQDLHTFCGASD